MPTPYHFETFITFKLDGTCEYGFCFKDAPDTDDVEFDLIIGRADPKDLSSDDDPSEPYAWVAQAIASGNTSHPIELLVMGEECPSDGEPLYWSNEDGWVDRDSATALGVEDALSGIHGLIGAMALELKAPCQTYEVTTHRVMPDGTTEDLGTQIIAARNPEKAEATAQDLHWDNRYDITGIHLTHDIETVDIDDPDEIDIDAS